MCRLPATSPGLLSTHVSAEATDTHDRGLRPRSQPRARTDPAPRQCGRSRGSGPRLKFLRRPSRTQDDSGIRACVSTRLTDRCTPSRRARQVLKRSSRQRPEAPCRRDRRRQGRTPSTGAQPPRSGSSGRGRQLPRVPRKACSAGGAEPLEVGPGCGARFAETLLARRFRAHSRT